MFLSVVLGERGRELRAGPFVSFFPVFIGRVPSYHQDLLASQARHRPVLDLILPAGPSGVMDVCRSSPTFVLLRSHHSYSHDWSSRAARLLSLCSCRASLT